MGDGKASEVLLGLAGDSMKDNIAKQTIKSAVQSGGRIKSLKVKVKFDRKTKRSGSRSGCSR